jgi:hypothetical protein
MVLPFPPQRARHGRRLFGPGVREFAGQTVALDERQTDVCKGCAVEMTRKQLAMLAPISAVSHGCRGLLIIELFRAIAGRVDSIAARAMLPGCEVRHAAEYVGALRGRVLPDYFEVEHTASPVLHRPLDILLASVALIIAVPTFAVAAGAILLSMGRPKLFNRIVWGSRDACSARTSCEKADLLPGDFGQGSSDNEAR